MDEEELLPRAGYDMKEEEEKIRRRRQEEESAMWIRGTPIESYVLFVKNNLVRLTKKRYDVFVLLLSISIYTYKFHCHKMFSYIFLCFSVLICLFLSFSLR